MLCGKIVAPTHVVVAVHRVHAVDQRDLQPRLPARAAGRRRPSPPRPRACSGSAPSRRRRAASRGRRRRCRPGRARALRSAWVIWPAFSAGRHPGEQVGDALVHRELLVEVRQAVGVHDDLRAVSAGAFAPVTVSLSGIVSAASAARSFVVATATVADGAGRGAGREGERAGGRRVVRAGLGGAALGRVRDGDAAPRAGRRAGGGTEIFDLGGAALVDRVDGRVGDDARLQRRRRPCRTPRRRPWRTCPGAPGGRVNA